MIQKLKSFLLFSQLTLSKLGGSRRVVQSGQQMLQRNLTRQAKEQLDWSSRTASKCMALLEQDLLDS